MKLPITAITPKHVEEFANDAPVYLIHYQMTLPGARRDMTRAEWMPRATRRDVEMHGRVISAGKLVLPLIGSANRDPKQFKDAGRFDITRETKVQLGWGNGAHTCIGIHLSKLEMQALLRAMVLL